MTQRIPWRECVIGDHEGKEEREKSKEEMRMKGKGSAQLPPFPAGR
jgi:hypothetical protein